jgi:hypothetical protein
MAAGQRVSVMSTTPLTMSGSFRSLCDELVRAMDSYPLRPKAHRDLCNRVRGALSTVKLNEPTRTELHETYIEAYKACQSQQGPDAQEAGLRAVLARWG